MCMYRSELPMSTWNLWSCLRPDKSCHWLYPAVNIAMNNNFKNTPICTLQIFSVIKLDLALLLDHTTALKKTRVRLACILFAVVKGKCTVGNCPRVQSSTMYSHNQYRLQILNFCGYSEKINAISDKINNMSNIAHYNRHLSLVFMSFIAYYM